MTFHRDPHGSGKDTLRNRNVRHGLYYLLFLVIGGVVSACGSASPTSSSGLVRFPVVPVSYAADFALFDNGQMIEQPFLDAYRSMEGERWLGRAIAKTIADADLGWRLQMFEFGVLAQDPTDGHVFLVKLSDLLSRRQPATKASTDPSCSYVTETGHNICYEFRDFALAAGANHIGRPVAEMAIDDQGALYQDFEYSRLRYLQTGMDRERIGETFFVQRGYDQALRRPVINVMNPTADAARMYASLARTTLHPGEEQSLRVVIVDPSGGGVDGIPLRVTLQENGIAILEIALPPTDAGGVSSLVFRVPQADPGTRIRVMITGSLHGVPLEAVAEFEVWW
jgi:hypothetical protein